MTSHHFPRVLQGRTQRPSIPREEGGRGQGRKFSSGNFSSKTLLSGCPGRGWGVECWDAITERGPSPQGRSEDRQCFLHVADTRRVPPGTRFCGRMRCESPGPGCPTGTQDTGQNAACAGGETWAPRVCRGPGCLRWDSWKEVR